MKPRTTVNKIFNKFFAQQIICLFYFCPLAKKKKDFRQNETPKELPNPFSFKHFLKQDTTTSNMNSLNGNNDTTGTSATNGISSSTSTGARPKIPQFQSVSIINNQSDSRMKRSPKFSSFDSQSSLSELAEERNMHGSRSNNCFNTDYQFPSSRSHYDIEPSPLLSDRKQNLGRRSQNNVSNTSNSSILPDFVQDHLLMESYYNNSDSPSANMSPLSCEDFSLGNSDSHMNHHQNGSKNTQNLSSDSFDMSYSNRSSNNRRRNNVTIPLDLPTTERSQRVNLPLLMDPTGSNIAVQREETYGPHNEPEITREQAAIDKMQTLPDFLSDGPIHSSGRLADIATISVDEDNQSIVIRLQQENERLRTDLEESRRIIIDLEQQISHAKNLETQYNVTLAESMEQVEENLFASNQRAVEAEVLANKYKQQVKQLTVSKNKY